MITSPITAAIIESRALSMLDLSPPEVIQRIPPISKNINAITAANINMKEISPPTACPIEILHTLLPNPVGQKLPVLDVASPAAANEYCDRDKKETIPVEITEIFFMFFIFTYLML